MRQSRGTKGKDSAGGTKGFEGGKELSGIGLSNDPTTEGRSSRPGKARIVQLLLRRGVSWEMLLQKATFSEGRRKTPGFLVRGERRSMKKRHPFLSEKGEREGLITRLG